jgi:ABC-type antimicrobial peptide transport system permease subunit
MLDDLLYGVSPANPWVFASAAVLLAITVLAACMTPTLQALRLDPLAALRSQ